MDTETADSVIDAAIAGQGTQQADLGPNQGKVQPDDTSSLFPSLAPDEEEIERSPEEQAIADQTRALLGDEAADELEEAQAKREAEEKTPLGKAKKLLNGGKETASKAGNWLGGLPTPGDLTVPLIILGILWLLLVTYNGNTRFQWVWLVLTGNAFVTGSNQDSSQNTQPSSPQGGGKSSNAPPTFQFETLSLPVYSVNGTYGSESFL